MEDTTILGFKTQVRLDPTDMSYAKEIVMPLVSEIIRLRCQYEDMIDPSVSEDG